MIFLLLGVKGRGKKQPHLVEDERKGQGQAGDHGDLHLDEKRLQGGHVVEPMGIDLGRLRLFQAEVGEIGEFLHDTRIPWHNAISG